MQGKQAIQKKEKVPISTFDDSIDRCPFSDGKEVEKKKKVGQLMGLFDQAFSACKSTNSNVKESIDSVESKDFRPPTPVDPKATPSTIVADFDEDSEEMVPGNYPAEREKRERPNIKKRYFTEQDLDLSDGSWGSLAEMRREMILSIYKNITMESDAMESTASDQTDSSEVYSVFKNSGLKIRGIDLDNMVTKDGKKFNMYQLYKARFQQLNPGNIRNDEVINFVNMLTGEGMTDSARRFVYDPTDYRRDGYKAEKDPNFKDFEQLWKQTNKPRVQTIQSPTANVLGNVNKQN